MRPAPPRLLAISPGDHRRGRDLIWLLEGAARAGLAALLLREPQLNEAELVATARSLAPLLPEGGLILHSRGAGAAALAAHAGFGLHLPAGTSALTHRPAIRGLLGQSCHNAIELAIAAAAGCDYALLSPVFRPTSKPEDGRPPLGMERFSALARGTALPVIALGGLDPARAAALHAGGAAGVAGLGAFFGPEASPESVEAAVAAWRAALPPAAAPV